MRLQFKLLPLIWFIQITTINQCWCVLFLIWCGLGLLLRRCQHNAYFLGQSQQTAQKEPPPPPTLKTNQIQHKCKSLGGTDTHSLLKPEETQPRAVSKGWNVWMQWPTDDEWPGGSLPPGLNAGFATKFKMSTSTSTSRKKKKKKKLLYVCVPDLSSFCIR